MKFIDRHNIFLSVICVLLVIIVVSGVYYFSCNYDPYETDLYLNQSYGGICSHDETYTEPILPNGRYYPNGDIYAEYYMEITENKYIQLVAANGKQETILKKVYDHIIYINTLDGDQSNINYDFFQILEKREFKIITDHFKDNVFLCYQWSNFKPKHKGAYKCQKYTIEGNAHEVLFEDDGSILLFNPLEQGGWLILVDDFNI